MIKSMTGFGRAEYNNEGRSYTVELKSVNHKYNDITIKIPRSIGYLEEKVRKEVLNNISRGKIDIYITFSNYSNKGKNIKINREMAKIYIDELKKLATEENIINDISIMEIAKYPEVMEIENNVDEELIWNELLIALKLTLDNFITMRINEGIKIAEDLKIRIQKITEKIEFIKKYSTGLVEEYIVKLEERIKEILKTDIIDHSRLSQEVVIYSDKCSIEEEITRLKSHIVQFTNLLEQNNPVGKKLDFIIQEMNRETNTIASKANNLDITNIVIEIKTEIENIREQIQNIE